MSIYTVLLEEAKQKVRQQKQTVVTNKNTTPRPANNHINLKHLKVQSKKKLTVTT